MKRMNVSRLLYAGLLINAIAANAGGVDALVSAIEIKPELLISGFGNAGASKTNATEIDFIVPISGSKLSIVPTYAGVSDKVNFAGDTLGGLQFVTKINDEISFTAQFVTQSFIDYGVQTDWLLQPTPLHPFW